MTIRELAIQFIRPLVFFGAKPGDLLELGPLRFPVRKHFPAAMEYAVEQGWVTKSNAEQYHLTDAGFAAAKIPK
jgi:hypothetical protein